jgi:NDP-mannose synthase
MITRETTEGGRTPWVLRPALSAEPDGAAVTPEVRLPGPRQAVILAGGLGVRLRPYTLSRPKPLIEIGGVPVLEILIRQLRAVGVTRITLCVSYLAGVVQDVLADGRRLGVRIDYSIDAERLGTAGPLTLLPAWSEPVIVLNADVLTALDFGRLYRHHLNSGASLTVAAHMSTTPIRYGVLDVRHGCVLDIWEKPHLVLDLCTGIYVMSPEARAQIPERIRSDMPQLMKRMVSSGQPVNAYRFGEEWHDIGTVPGLTRARQSFEKQPSAYLLDAATLPAATAANGTGTVLRTDGPQR